MSISKRTRFRVFRRDNYACIYCGRRAPAVTLEVDHRIPKASGGSDAIENLVSACWDCNRGKGPLDADGEGSMAGLPIWEQYEEGWEAYMEDLAVSVPDELPRWFSDTRGHKHHISLKWDWEVIATIEQIPIAKRNWKMTPVKVLALAEAFDTVEVI